MKTKVERGYYHNVRSDNGCTVTQIKPNGQTLVDEIPAGGTTAVFAFSSEFEVSDDTAVVQQVFKLAPYQKLRLLGVVGGDKLPAGYTRLEYLESTGYQYMVTDFIPTNESGIYLDCQVIVNQDVIPCGCRNSSTEHTRFYAIRPPILANSGKYLAGYGWGAWVTIDAPEGYYRDKTYLNWRNNRLAQCKTSNHSLQNLSFTPIYPAYIFAANVKSVPSHLFIGKIWRVAFSQEENVVRDFIPALTTDGQPCMYDRVKKKALTNAGGGGFICGIETAQQLDTVLRRLPDRTGQNVGTLQVRLADDLQTPENLAKLDAMLAKNWEISQAA
jgi:hypothetical protein